MPLDARILSVGVQNDFPVVWVQTEGKGVRVEARVFSVITTGERFDERSTVEFLGTVTLGKDMHSGQPSAWYVAHIFQGYLKSYNNKDEDRREIATELR